MRAFGKFTQAVGFLFAVGGFGAFVVGLASAPSPSQKQILAFGLLVGLLGLVSFGVGRLFTSLGR